MSSANLIAHRYKKELVFGELNPGGTWQDVSKTSAQFSGTPDTIVSATIRSDRLSSGNVITGMTVNATLSNELSRTVVHDEFLEATMMDPWEATPAPIGPIDLDYTAATGILTSVAGGLDGLAVGDAFTITGMTVDAAAYNLTTVFVVLVVTDGNTITAVTSSAVEDFADAAATIQGDAQVIIGKVMSSYTWEKQYLDLTDKAIDYYGEVFSSFTASFNYGAAVTIDYEMQGAGKTIPTTPLTQPAGADPVLPAPTEDFFNVATSMPLLIMDGEVATSCIEGITVSLDNGLSAKNCVGTLKKAGYDLGTASVEVTVNAHFSDANFDFLQKILDQDTVTIAWPVVDSDGYGYHFQVSCQLTADDPDADGGQDSQAMLALTGGGAIGADGTMLVISKLGGDLP